MLIFIITGNYILILSCTLKNIDTLPNFFSNTYIRSVFPTQFIEIHMKNRTYNVLAVLTYRC